MTPQEAERPKVSAGGLVTIAYLKARLDEGDDHLGIFIPLVTDVLPDLPNRNFTTSEVQEALATKHGVAMPQEAVTTLLKRAARQGILVREAGRFHLTLANANTRMNVAGEKALLEASQTRLAGALMKHSNRRGLEITSPQEALDLILRFLEEQQVALLLGSPPDVNDAVVLSRMECGVVAEFIHDVVGNDEALTAVLGGILKGLVLYHAAFLPDLAGIAQRFDDLTVVFDSMLVRQALGYEGEGPQLLSRETINLLASSGVDCVVFALLSQCRVRTSS